MSSQVLLVSQEEAHRETRPNITAQKSGTQLLSDTDAFVLVSQAPPVSPEEAHHEACEAGWEPPPKVQSLAATT